MSVRGIRGATVVDANTAESIENATVELTNEILRANNISPNDIAQAIFTLTNDLNAAFPAKFARIHCGFELVPMMCYQELEVPNSIRMCLRALFTVNTEKSQKEIHHVYLRGAKALRKDLSEDNIK